MQLLVLFLPLFYLAILLFAHRERVRKLKGAKSAKRGRDWIMEKKERRRRKGLEVRPDTKFTGRKRSGKLW